MKKRKSTIGTTSSHWFARGLVGGIMLVAAANALSYFFRTPGIADLVGPDQNVIEAIGFPFEIWREDHIYHDSMYLNYVNVGWNLLIGVAIGSGFGLIALKLQKQFNRWVADFESQNTNTREINLQFSVKSLLVITTVAAALIAAFTSWNGTKQVLMAVYFLGPICLILIAMMPNKIHWHHRIVILTIMAAVIIGVAISTGIRLEVPLDRVMLGIFVSWTPQSAFAAFVLLIGLIVHALWAGSPFKSSDVSTSENI